MTTKYGDSSIKKNILRIQFIYFAEVATLEIFDSEAFD